MLFDEDFFPKIRGKCEHFAGKCRTGFEFKSVEFNKQKSQNFIASQKKRRNLKKNRILRRMSRISTKNDFFL